MICFKCKYFPCIREECDLHSGKCEYGKSIKEFEIKEIEEWNYPNICQ